MAKSKGSVRTTSKPAKAGPKRKPAKGAGFSSFDGSTFFNDTDTDGAVPRKITVGTVEEKATGDGLGATVNVGPGAGFRIAAMIANKNPAQVTVTVNHVKAADGSDPKMLGPLDSTAVANFYVAEVTVVLTKKPTDVTKRRLLLVSVLVNNTNPTATAIRRNHIDEA
jgi:hypothetical protein